jgi:L-fuconolactonase
MSGPDPVLVVDAQVHLWGADRPDRPWPRDRGVRGEPHRTVPPAATSLLAEMDRAGVGAATL